MTRTVRCRYLKPDGERCTAPAAAPEAEVHLCASHIAGAVGALDAARRVLWDDESREHMAALELAQAVRNARAQDSGIVYYARAWDHIKIGTTTDITQRMRDLHATEVLATEPGTHLTETMRHQQFAHLRVLGEYFRPTPELLEHVEAIRAKNGPPITTTDQQLLVRGGRGAGPANPPRDAAGLGKARLAQALRRPR